VIWGGASKGVIFSLLLQREGVVFDAVIDVNPAKQGKYLPASGLLVESPEEVLPRLSGDSMIWVMNSNYLSEIKARCKQCHYAPIRYIVIDGDPG